MQSGAQFLRHKIELFLCISGEERTQTWSHFQHDFWQVLGFALHVRGWFCCAVAQTGFFHGLEASCWEFLLLPCKKPFPIISPQEIQAGHLCPCHEDAKLELEAAFIYFWDKPDLGEDALWGDDGWHLPEPLLRASSSMSSPEHLWGMSEPAHLNAQKSRVFKASCVHAHKSPAIPRAWQETGCQFGTWQLLSDSSICHPELALGCVYRNPKARQMAFPGVLRGHRWNIWHCCHEERRDLGALQKFPSKIQPLPVVSCGKEDPCPFLSSPVLLIRPFLEGRSHFSCPSHQKEAGQDLAHAPGNLQE